MLRWRLLLGTLFIALLSVLFWLDAQQSLNALPGLWTFPLLVLVSVLGSTDLLFLYRAQDWQPPPKLFCIGNFLLVLVNAIPLFIWTNQEQVILGRWGWSLLVLLLLMLLGFIVEMYHYQQPGRSVLHLALLAFGWLYVGMLLTTLLQLRILMPGGQGILAIASMILFVKLGDTGAYTFGRLFGKHKLTPILSPGKTWEGALGALVFAALGAWCVTLWWLPQLELRPLPATTNLEQNLHHTWSILPLTLRWILYAGVMAIVGIAGDLAESLLKRDLGRKDSSDWLPGFGGTLDLLDSLLFAGPVAYLIWLSGWLSVV
jgi:phosphatidate cytidylyltransferase